MIPKTLKNFNLFIDGRGYAGRVEEITLPKLTIKTEEFRAGGMDAPIPIDMGMEKLQADLTLSEYDTDVVKKFGNFNNEMVPVILRGAMDDTKNSIIPVIVTLNGHWQEMDFGNWKVGDQSKLKIMVTAFYYKLEINGEELIEIDVTNMVRKVNGTDYLKAMRDALGL